MPHLLLVDDDEDILALLTSFFRQHSHIVLAMEICMAASNSFR